ncbi:MAG: hypothetical protein II136_06775, partial [Prevotella sp.]|nr:hypothetical protein [Prevotella sp.]
RERKGDRRTKARRENGTEDRRTKEHKKKEKGTEDRRTKEQKKGKGKGRQKDRRTKEQKQVERGTEKGGGTQTGKSP